jgi:DNA/RNA endonuclease G (NUC1)/V8-like Glu-specific endopeptidase
MAKDISAEVGFFQSPKIPTTASGLRDEVAETLALPNVDRGGLMVRTISLRNAGVMSDEDLRRATEDGDDELLELTVGKSNILPAWFLDVGPLRSSAVCKIEASGTNYKGEENEDWVGTGFLVSENILLTNHHVINSEEVARKAECVFNYQRNPENSALKIERFRLNPDRLFLTSPTRDGLDFTFVWVEGAPGTKFKVIPFNRNYFEINKGDVANIIHHPGGDYKCVTLQENHVVKPYEAVVHYISDTEPGSSGSCVFNNQWMPFALHHAARKNEEVTAETPYKYLNEGVRFSAIAAYLEGLHKKEVALRPRIEEVLKIVRGTDPVMGHFGGLGRDPGDAATGVEAVVNLYKGEAEDIDVAFWNIEHFEDRYEEKLEQVADIIYRMNLDVWAFEESSREATEALAEYLNNKYKTKYRCEFSEPNASSDKQTTTVMWNSETVDGQKVKWPDEIEKWLREHSKNFDDLDLTEAAQGKIFDRYPALYRFKSKLPGGGVFDFNLIPLHLKAFDEGQMRRRMAAAIIGAAIKKMIDKYGADRDWIVGGDFNAPLASQDFAGLLAGGMVPVSAGDEQGGALSYVKSPLSMIDHIFLSPNLADTYGEGDFFIVAHDKKIPDYVKSVSDHRPVLLRLSLKGQPQPEGKEPVMSLNLPESLREALSSLDWFADAERGDGERPSTEGRGEAPTAADSLKVTVPVEITVSSDGAVSVSGRTGVSEAEPSPVIITEGVNINTDYSSRTGYDPEFLGKGSMKVPLPKLSAAMKAKASINREANGGDKYLLPYHHYSLVMNRERKIAFYTATNIDGHTQHRFDLGDREGDSWIKDHRIDADDQIGPELYAGNPLDKGHLTRRLDPAWGDSKKFAKMANDDTFHYTNCCPQHQRFNRNKSTWAGLEDFILNNALAKGYRATVFTGPIFKDSDPEFEGVKIPLQFWKVVALVGASGKLSASVYRLGQAELIEDMLEEAFKPTTHQITIRKLEELTSLDFGSLSDYDAIGDEEAFGMKEIVSFADIKI